MHDKCTRRGFLAGSLATITLSKVQAAEKKRPNILFAVADDWSWPHASISGCPELHTPAFDRVAREGCLFTNTFTAAPQCSPNRAATLTGRAIWQIEEAGTHASIFPHKYPVYTELLEQEGYHVGFTGKGWGPGDWKRGGFSKNPAGAEYNHRKLKKRPNKSIRDCDYAANFEDFLAKQPEDAPFCFWFGCNEPHRSYEWESGLHAGKNVDKVEVPPFLPDTPLIRKDVLDYFLEIEWFDSHLARMLALLEAKGELDNTIVVVTGDNGMPFPSAKANLYDYGTHVPLAIRWPGHVSAQRTEDTPVSFIDFAPTFLEAAGAPAAPDMTGRSFLPLLTAEGVPHRDHALTGRERHTHARFDNWGYPARAIRTKDFLYIHNMKPDRWPAGDPDQYHDIDGCPAKTLLLENQEEHARFFKLAMAKRPEEELFSMKDDPGCLNNLASDPEFAEKKKELSALLHEELTEQGDPRMHGRGDIFESYPRVSHMRPQLGGFAERGEYNPKYQQKPQ
jgi:N-sulfoglucosamine sulfohydrolase